MPRTKRPSACDRILATATDLFYKEGVQNVGIDRIIAESGVAKMSLYNNFKSKDELIAAYLQQQDENWGNWFTRRVEEIATDPRERLLVVLTCYRNGLKNLIFGAVALLILLLS